jgi:hypothetical protein
MTNGANPQEAQSLTQTTSLDGLSYLPSPPVTPICKRSIRFDHFSYFYETDHSDTSSQASALGRSIAKSRGGNSRAVNSAKSPVKHRSKPAKKLSIRRQLLETHKSPKRLGITKSKSLTTKSAIAKPRGQHKLKIKQNFNNVCVPSHDAKGHFTVKAPEDPKFKKKSSATKAKCKPNGRTTNNSLSTTLNPPIFKRKIQRNRPPTVGKICSSYYPSNRKLTPNDPGQRYPKGEPYLPPLATI